MPGIGSWAFATDPSGALFAPFQDETSGNQPELPSGVQPDGAIAWHEVMATIGETPVAGLMKRPDDVPVCTWTIYFESPGTIAESAAMVTELGGTVLREPFTVEGTGDILIAADPTGAVFGMLKSAPMA